MPRTNARGEKTRLAILDALLSLTAEGDLRPTVPRVAERAGLSLRSVFHHFSDVDALLGAALDRQLERCAALPRGVPLEMPLPQRIDRFTRQRARLFEEMAPVRRALMLHESHSPMLGERAALMRRVEHDEALAGFGDAITQLPAAERSLAEAALATAASFDAWLSLRLHQALAPDAARRALQRLVASQVQQLGAGLLANGTGLGD